MNGVVKDQIKDKVFCSGILFIKSLITIVYEVLYVYFEKYL